MGSKKRVKDPFLYGRVRNKLLDDLNEALEKESIDRQSYDEIYNMLTAEVKELGLDDSGTISRRSSPLDLNSAIQRSLSNPSAAGLGLASVADYFSVAQSVQNKLKEASEYFSKAVEGIDPKFKARRKTELLYKTITDQPGRRQFAFGPTTGRTSGSRGPLGVGSLIDNPNAGRRGSAGLLEI